MTWTPAFLRSRPFKYGFTSGLVTLAAGAGGSAVIALKMASYCSEAVTSFISEIGQNITVSGVNAVVHLGKYDLNLTLGDIDVVFPKGWLDMINSTKELPPYCFIAPLTIGLCITVAASLALASTVALAVHTREGERVYRLHQLEGVVDGDDFDASQALLRNG